MDLLEAQNLTWETMQKHGLDHWTFQWSRAKTFLGMCSYHNRTIYLSKPLTAVNSVETMTNTILHEIAHALCGPGTGHGPKWKAMAASIGAKPNRVADKHTTVLIPKKYFALHHCGATFKRDRLPSSNRYCTKCWNRSGRDREFSVLVWVDAQTQAEVGTVSMRAAQRIG